MVDCLSILIIVNHLIGFLDGIILWLLQVGLYLYASLRFDNQNELICMRAFGNKEQRQKFPNVNPLKTHSDSLGFRNFGKAELSR